MTLTAERAELAPVSQPQPRPGALYMRRAARRSAPTVIIVVGLLAIWIFLTHVLRVSPIILPAPFDVLRYVVDNWSRFAAAIAQSGTTILLGLLLGVVFGSVSAVIAWWSAMAAGFVRPLAELAGAIPLAVLVPVLSRILGYGDSAAVAITAILCFFPAYAMLTASLKDYPPGSYDYFAVTGANKAQLLARLAMPSALAGFMLALQLCAIIAVLGAVSTEFLTGSGGLGLLMAQTGIAENGVSSKWASAIITTVFAYIVYLVMRSLNRFVTASMR